MHDQIQTLTSRGIVEEYAKDAGEMETSKAVEEGGRGRRYKQWRTRRGGDVRVRPIPFTHPTSPSASHLGYCPSPRSQLAHPI